MNLSLLTTIEKLRYVAHALERTGCRTDRGFEMFVNVRGTGHVYSVLLSYGFDIAGKSRSDPPVILYMDTTDGVLQTYKVLNEEPNRVIASIANALHRQAEAKMGKIVMGQAVSEESRQVMMLMMAGYKNKEIASILEVNRDRVRTIQEACQRLFGVRNDTSLAVTYALNYEKTNYESVLEESKGVYDNDNTSTILSRVSRVDGRQNGKG